MMIERLSKIRSEAQIRHQTLAEVFREKVFPITLYREKSKERYGSDIEYFFTVFDVRSRAARGASQTQSL